MRENDTLSEEGPNFEAFTAPVRDLIEGTIARMRQYAIGYPTLDARVDGEADFVGLLSAKLVNSQVVEKNSCDDPVSAGYLEGLMTPAAFRGPSARDRHASALTFWAFVRAIQDLSTTSGQYGLNEVARNTGLFGHLSSTLRTFWDLEGMSDADGLIYWADFASLHLEPEVGADFAIVVSLGNNRYKVAFLQAKRVRHFPDAKVHHYVESRRRNQIDILVDHERSNLEKASRNCGSPDEKDQTISGRWCFYVFWHEVTGDGDLLLPTVRSAHAVKKTMKGQLSSSLADGVELAAFVTLFLADPESRVGYLVEADEMTELFKGHRPSSLLFLDPAADGLAPEAKATLLVKLGYVPASPGSGLIRRFPDSGTYASGMRGW